MEEVKFVDIHTIMYQNSDSEEDSNSDEDIDYIEPPEVKMDMEDDSGEEFQFPDNDFSRDDHSPSPPSKMWPEDDVVSKTSPKKDPKMYFVGSKFLPNLGKRYAEYDKLFKYRCDQCLNAEDGSMEFANFKEMREHFKKVHKSKTGRAYCCGQEILEKNFAAHLRQHLVPDEFKCEECGKQCDNKKMLTDHKCERSQSPQSIFCEECGNQFNSTKDYEEHVSTIHRSVYSEELISNFDELFLYLCDDCLDGHGKPKRFADFTQMRGHFKDGHKGQDGYAFCCGIKVPYNDFSDHLRLQHSIPSAPEQFPGTDDCDESFETEEHKSSKHESPEAEGNKPLECTTCNTKFDLQKDYEEHLNTTHKETTTAPGNKQKKKKKKTAADIRRRKYNCSACEESFWSHQARNTHMAEKHKDVKIFSCKLCGHNYRSYVYLVRHNCEKAEGPQKDDRKLFRHFCNPCEIKFDSEKELNRHYRSPVHNPKVICDLCGKSYNKNNLHQHMKVKHNESGDFICQDCGKSYPSEPCLYQHRRLLHSDIPFHPCTICDFKTKFRQTLYNHSRLKHGVNPNGTPFVPLPSQIFECSVCNKSCRTKLALQEHMAVHTGDRKFQCEYCSASFKTASNFYKHRKEHHPIEYADWKMRAPERTRTRT